MGEELCAHQLSPQNRSANSLPMCCKTSCGALQRTTTAAVIPSWSRTPGLKVRRYFSCTRHRHQTSPGGSCVTPENPSSTLARGTPPTIRPCTTTSSTLKASSRPGPRPTREGRTLSRGSVINAKVSQNACRTFPCPTGIHRRRYPRRKHGRKPRRLSNPAGTRTPSRRPPSTLNRLRQNLVTPESLGTRHLLGERLSDPDPEI